MIKYFLAFVAGLLLFSCKKASDIGSNLLPDDDLALFYTDTLSLITQTDFDSTVRSDRTTYSYIGHVNDPVFGSSEASLFAQFSLFAIFKDTIGTNTLDSIILYVQYDKFYGDSTFPQSFDIYRVTEKPNRDITYRSDYAFATSDWVGNVSGVTFSPSQRFYFGLTDTVGVAGILRIPLSAAFGNDILAQSGTAALKNDTSFKNYFPGLLIRPSGASGRGMAQIDLRSAFSKISLYYRNAANDTVRLDFPTAFTNFWHDKYVHQFGGSLVQPAIKTGAAAGDAQNFVIGQGGIKTSVEIPHLADLGAVAINKATLEIYQIFDASNPNIPAPRVLYAHTRNADGTYENISDYNLISTFGFNYYSRSDTIIDNFSRKVLKYSINISDYLQDVVSGRKTNQPLYISDTPIRSNSVSSISGDFVPHRIIIGGSDRTDDYKIKLQLKYSLPD
jgi:hypothetical protein